MGQFLEVRGWPWHGRHAKRDSDLDTFHVRVGAIIKVVPLELKDRLYVSLNGDPAPSNSDPYYKSATDKYIDSCELVFNDDPIATHSYATRVAGTSHELVAKIEECSVAHAVKTDQAIRRRREEYHAERLAEAKQALSATF
ncbi:MAG: hypothetical protein F4039_07330 [Gammaproteobacteria bacterium]|nr:hypothetical protein [Gammaproteobacteria bacterium]MYK43881.1 hypothetical protein [Gammaproteobacteria bacterium]